MYFRSARRVDPVPAYVFPRPQGGGVILGGSRHDNDWSDNIDDDLSEEIKRRCCELCPELGKAEDLQVLSVGVGHRRK
jgi:D-amino-acid oxidase